MSSDTRPPRSEAVTEWFQARRGIKPETLDLFGIGTNENGHVLYPYPNGVKLRKHLDGPADQRGIAWEAPLGPGGVELFGPAQPGRPTYIITEGESDAMRLTQALAEAGRLDQVGVYGLSGAHGWKRRFTERFGGADVFVVLDNEPAGKQYEAAKSAAETVETGWTKIQGDLGTRAKRILLPPDTKDVCEFFAAYDLAAWDALVKNAGKEPPWPPVRPRLIEAMTTKQLAELKPEPLDWLVEPILASGAITMLAGMMKAAGKSTWAKDLATAIAFGEEFAGWPTQRGSVIYVTEESPDVFKHSIEENHPRLLETDAVIPIFQAQLFALSWEQVVEEAVLEAKARGAKLIVFDTLMDLAGVVDENSSADASRVMPLLKRAQAQGLAILLLVHSPKAQDLAIEQMFRGHGSWFGAVDQGLALRPDDSNYRTLEMLGRLTRGRDRTRLLWTPREGWARVTDARETAATSTAKAIHSTLVEAPGQRMTRASLLKSATVAKTAPAVIESAIMSSIAAGWLRERRAEPGEMDPATGLRYRGHGTRLLELTGAVPDFADLDDPDSPY